jgi:hypothetical protein
MRGSWALGVTGVLVVGLLAGCEDGRLNGRMDCCAYYGGVYRNLWCEETNGDVRAPEAMCLEEERHIAGEAQRRVDAWQRRQPK